MAPSRNTPEAIVRDIKRKTRRVFNAEEKIRIILEALRGEETIAEISRREGIHTSQYYKWSKEFLNPIRTENTAQNCNQMRNKRTGHTW